MRNRQTQMLNRHPPAGRFVRMTSTISVILNLIQNQLDPDFRQDDNSIRNTIYLSSP